MSDEPVQVESVRADVAIRQATDAAGVCKAIVLKSSKKIGTRKYIMVEGWQAIAVAHGCMASSRAVEPVEGGIRAIGEVRRMSDGALLAQAEGFVGDDEPMWAQRPLYARRAMAQTRAISRACRSAFAHVVVMMEAGLSTTPAEEMSDDEDGPAPAPAAQQIEHRPAPRADLPRVMSSAEWSTWLDKADAAAAGLGLCKRNHVVHTVTDRVRAKFPKLQPHFKNWTAEQIQYGVEAAKALAAELKAPKNGQRKVKDSTLASLREALAAVDLSEEDALKLLPVVTEAMVLRDLSEEDAQELLARAEAAVDEAQREREMEREALQGA